MNPYRHGDIDIEKIIYLVIVEMPTGQTVVILGIPTGQTVVTLGKYQFSPMHSFDMEKYNFLC